MFYAENVTEVKELSGAKCIELNTFSDLRGEIWPLYSVDNDFLPSFIEDKVSISRRGVLRGLHGDSEIGKLITCLSGQFQLVAADLRKGSKTYGNTHSWILDDRAPISIYVPPGCVNGHLCLSSRCVFHYKWTKSYSGAEKQATIKWNDSALNIKWMDNNPILSERDQNGAESTKIFL
jgi:dTDP-4-dehydrorhamnose 3,5-epimerase